MKTIRENIEELLERGWSVEHIAGLTKYPIEEIKKAETNWRNHVKTKGGDIDDL